jgi:hypothetical protein
MAAAAMAGLSASQVPGLGYVTVHRAQASPPPGPPIDGGSPYFTALPPLNAPTPSGTPTGSPQAGTGGTSTGTVTGSTGIPATVLDAYLKAQASVAGSDPGCGLRWQLLAAIGQVESNQARGGAVDAQGTTISPIYGPLLDGNGFARITDTDGGKWDGNATYDRAVGPMQFIPSTWATWGADGNGDGVKDPNNIFDAALAAGHYLCAAGGDLSSPTGLDQAILGYNHSQAYVDLVKTWYQHFLNGGAVTVPNSSGAGNSTTAPRSTPSASASASPSASASASPSASNSAKPTATPSGTIRPTVAATASGSPSVPPTATASPSPSPTGTTCPTGTPSPTVTPTGTPSPTVTPTGTPSPTVTPTGSPSPTVTPTGTASPTTSPSPCGTVSPSPSGTATP